MFNFVNTRGTNCLKQRRLISISSFNTKLSKIFYRIFQRKTITQILNVAYRILSENALTCNQVIHEFNKTIFLRELENFIILIDKNACGLKFKIANVRKTNNKKQPPEVFHKRTVLKSFSIFTGKCLCWSLFFAQVADLQFCNFIKKRFRCRCFSVNITKILKTAILNKICK